MASVKDKCIYWDSSALIKWYINEEESSKVRIIFKSAQFHHTASISHAEIIAAFSRLCRENIISKRDGDLCIDKFIKDFRSFLVIDYSTSVRIVAEEIASKTALRGADLVQLSSAIKLKREGLPIILASFDRVLINAAIDCALEVI